jgi:hypothetical protein
MIKFFSLTSLLLLSALSGDDSTSVVQEKSMIKEMCGCYKVDFQYAETFSEVEGYEYRDRYEAHGLEWIFVDEESDEKVVMQHLLIVNDSTIIKHWREDWLYENTSLLEYQRNLEWKRRELSPQQAAGTWSQKVYQVDDSPRYQGNATWIHVDGKKYWESRTAAPLPRREYTKRSDYNVMLRNNKHQITSYGHLHELDNAKVVRTEEKDSVLVWEKGLNTYTKVDDIQCEAARNWWKVNRMYWLDVRMVWDAVIAEHAYINIKGKVDNQPLWQRIFALGDTLVAEEKYNSKEAKAQIRKVIDLYVSNEPSAWTTN